MSLSPSVCLSVYLCLPVLCLGLSLPPSLALSVCLSISLSFSLSVCLSVCLSLSRSLSLSFRHPSLSLSVCLSVSFYRSDIRSDLIPSRYGPLFSLVLGRHRLMHCALDTGTLEVIN